MRRRDGEEPTNLTIVEAVETLSSIADLDLERDIGVSQRHDIAVGGRPITYRTVHWLQQTDADATLDVIKDTFRVVLRYVRSFYKEEHGYLTDSQTVEGIKTIMVLVGEAAKKLDRFTKLFHGARSASVMNTKEYKALQEFYQKRIARKIDEGTLGKWVLALTAPLLPKSAKAPVEVPAVVDMSKRVIIDLDTVKRDAEYELFFMRKDDGTRYFGPALLRNIRLVCDFGDYFGETKGDDPLGHLDVWRDWMYQITARSIVKTIRKEADNFYRLYAAEKDQEIVSLVNYMLMSLLLSANPRNLKRNRPVKSCHLYFIDFQNFLREILSSREYQKLVAYTPKKTHKLAWCVLKLIHEVCEGLYTHTVGYSEFPPLIMNLVEKARRAFVVPEAEEPVQMHWWDSLGDDYNAMLKLLKRHPNGPMYKILDMLKDEEHQYFDPLVQDNIPNRWFDMHIGDWIINNVRMPSPIRQDYIHKAICNDEFKGMLRSYRDSSDHGSHLLFNLQDRTSWLEHSRCDVLERLQDKSDFSDKMRVVTLATHTDFYQQVAPYHEANHADPFMEQLLDHMTGDGSGYFFPESIRKGLTPAFLSNAIKGVHEVFYGARNILLRRERLDFIQLVHMLVSLKVMEIVKPESISFTCKDGVDIGSSYSALLYGMLKLFNREEMTARDTEYLYLMMFGPPLFIRERAMLPEHFHRALGALKAIALAREEHGFSAFRRALDTHLAKLYTLPMLGSDTAIPEPVQVLY